MSKNWYALFLCIVKDVSPDKAIGKMLGKYLRKPRIGASS